MSRDHRAVSVAGRHRARELCERRSESWSIGFLWNLRFRFRRHIKFRTCVYDSENVRNAGGGGGRVFCLFYSLCRTDVINRTNGLHLHMQPSRRTPDTRCRLAEATGHVPDHSITWKRNYVLHAAPAHHHHRRPHLLNDRKHQRYCQVVCTSPPSNVKESR